MPMKNNYAALIDWGSHFPGAIGWHEVIAGLSRAEAEQVCREAAGRGRSRRPEGRGGAAPSGVVQPEPGGGGATWPTRSRR